MGIRPHGYAKCPRKAKISQLQIIPLVNKEILRLQVSMKDAVRMTIEEA
jgi:hypothetical protein